MASSWDSEGIQRGARPFAWRGISWPGHQTEGKVCKTKKVLKYILIQNACDIFILLIELVVGAWVVFSKVPMPGRQSGPWSGFLHKSPIHCNAYAVTAEWTWRNRPDGNPILIVSTSDPLRHRWLRKRKRSILSDFSVKFDRSWTRWHWHVRNEWSQVPCTPRKETDTASIDRGRKKERIAAVHSNT